MLLSESKDNPYASPMRSHENTTEWWNDGGTQSNGQERMENSKEPKMSDSVCKIRWGSPTPLSYVVMYTNIRSNTKIQQSSRSNKCKIYSANIDVNCLRLPSYYRNESLVYRNIEVIHQKMACKQFKNAVQKQTKFLVAKCKRRNTKK